jgi:hypothetical protein
VGRQRVSSSNDAGVRCEWIAIGGELLIHAFEASGQARWRNKERMREIYSKKPADKRPVWIVRPEGSDAQVIECLRFQMSIDGSRASWKPTPHNP